MSEEPRSAGKRKTERLSAGLDTSQTIEAVKTAREIDSTFRIYRMEWTFDSAWPSYEQAEAEWQVKYEDRLEDQDWEVRPKAGREELWVRRWNVVAEYKYQDKAEGVAAILREDDPDRDVRVVTRNSRSEVQLKNYGILKLVRPR